MLRFTNISKNNIQINVSDESLRDTLMDLHNYSAMALMCLEDNDNTVPETPLSTKDVQNEHLTDTDVNNYVLASILSTVVVVFMANFYIRDDTTLE